MTNRPADLQSILATLAKFAPAVQADKDAQAIEDRVENPSQQQERPPTHQTQDPRIKPRSRAAPPAARQNIDPATITSWPHGLRCVTKIAQQNEQFGATIRRMMADQRKHELRWYTERQGLKTAQSNRGASSAQAHSILQSLGGSTGPQSSDVATPANHAAELTKLDRKIFLAQQEMEAAMTAELNGLGVPFFGTEPGYIVHDNDDGLARQQAGSRAEWSPYVTQAQLTELRRRMVAHLEDLYRD